MKTKLKLIAGLAITLTAANAAVVTVDTGFTRGIVGLDNQSMAAGSGYIAVGYFSSIADNALATTSAAGLAADFQVFGGDSATFGKSGLAGFFAVSADTGAKISAGNPFVGKNIYLVAFNGANILSSTAGVIYKFGDVFVADPADPTPPSSLTPNFNVASSSSFLLGTNGSTLTGPVAAPAAKMVALVPEPSVALLGALGALGLIRRRR